MASIVKRKNSYQEKRLSPQSIENKAFTLCLARNDKTESFAKRRKIRSIKWVVETCGLEPQTSRV